VGSLSHWVYESIAACDHSAYHIVSLLVGAFREDIPYAQAQGRIILTLIGEVLWRNGPRRIAMHMAQALFSFEN
jgi:hypothetical protein